MPDPSVRHWRAGLAALAATTALVVPIGGAQAVPASPATGAAATAARTSAAGAAVAQPGPATPAEEWAAAIVLDVVGRQATHREVELTVDRLERGWPKAEIAVDLTRGREWAGTVVDDLYELILHRGPDRAGRAYWVDRLGKGSWTRDVAADLFGSPEFTELSGGSAIGYVDAVYERVLGRKPDRGGIDHWTASIEAGAPRSEVAIFVFTSVEANGNRVDDMYEHLLGRAPDAGGRAFWSQRLVTSDDLDLAALLVSSAEYQQRAEARTDLAPVVTGPGAEWVVSTPEAHGMDAAKIEEAYDYAFVDGRNTQGVVIVRNGEIVSERYAPGEDADDWAASWSMAKSFTSAAIGIAIAEGKIPSVDVPMSDYYPEWKGTPKEAITLRHVLWMSSGLQFTESYAPATFEASDIIQMVVFQIDQLAYAAARPLAHQPGTRFNYSSGDTMLLAGVIQKATGMPADEYIREKLLDPIAMEKVEWWRDGAGHTLGYCCFDTTSRGYARFGQLYLQRGRWGGQQIVPESWVEESWTPSPAYDGYGYQWWLDRSADPENPDRPEVFSARGHDGQFTYVIPELDLVVVRNGSYTKHPGAPVADPNLFGFYPPQNIVPGQGTAPPDRWEDWEFLGPIVDSIQG
jgi:CubicO group peptidase (beta-lactamase class C family)